MANKLPDELPQMGLYSWIIIIVAGIYVLGLIIYVVIPNMLDFNDANDVHEPEKLSKIERAYLKTLEEEKYKD